MKSQCDTLLCWICGFLGRIDSLITREWSIKFVTQNGDFQGHVYRWIYNFYWNWDSGTLYEFYELIQEVMDWMRMRIIQLCLVFKLLTFFNFYLCNIEEHVSNNIVQLMYTLDISTFFSPFQSELPPIWKEISLWNIESKKNEKLVNFAVLSFVGWSRSVEFSTVLILFSSTLQ